VFPFTPAHRTPRPIPVHRGSVLILNSPTSFHQPAFHQKSDGRDSAARKTLGDTLSLGPQAHGQGGKQGYDDKYHNPGAKHPKPVRFGGSHCRTIHKTIDVSKSYSNIILFN